MTATFKFPGVGKNIKLEARTALLQPDVESLEHATTFLATWLSPERLTLLCMMKGFGIDKVNHVSNVILTPHIKWVLSETLIICLL